jgi:hypothetical protein
MRTLAALQDFSVDPFCRHLTPHPSSICNFPYKILAKYDLNCCLKNVIYNFCHERVSCLCFAPLSRHWPLPEQINPREPTAASDHHQMALWQWPHPL